jgi:homoserine kinase type II
MNTIYLLWFVQEREQGEDTELLIGAFRTEDSAKDVIEQLKSQPGFRDYPEGFQVHPYELDKIASWSQGFVRV